MTLESYEKARDIVIEIRNLDAAISGLRDIMKNDTSKWKMEIRANNAHPSICIDHYGILPDVLDTIYSKHLEKREALMDKLAKL